MTHSSIGAKPATSQAEIDRDVLKASDEGRRGVYYRELRDRHWTMLAGAVCLIAASFSLRLRDSQTVGVKWLGVNLPPMCGSRLLFGVECPGCGLTRSFVALAAGDWRQSLEFHRLGWLLAVAVVGQIPYRVYALRELRFGRVERAWAVWFGYLLVAALIVNWLLDVVWPLV